MIELGPVCLIICLNGFFCTLGTECTLGSTSWRAINKGKTAFK